MDPSAHKIPFVVDSHQHVWNLKRTRYTWMKHVPGVLRRTYTQAEVDPEMDALGVAATVLVQAEDNLEDTANMLDTARSHPHVAGVVAWAPLTSAEKVSVLAEKWRDQRAPVVGVRHLIHRELDVRWLLRRDVSEGLEVLAEAGLPFEVCAETPELLALLPALAEAHPKLRMILDHLGKPPIREQGWEPWATLLREGAALPGVVAKVSGLNTAARLVDWSGEDFIPYVEHAVDCFGAERLMFGGDWPYALINAVSYTQVHNGIRIALAGLPATEIQQILGTTACRVYGLDRALIAERGPSLRP